MFENITKFFKNRKKKTNKSENHSRETAKERLHLVLMQDRANVSADFLELMKQEIIEVIKKYIDVDESAIDVRLTNKENSDGTNGAPALYANIPILNIKNEARKVKVKVKEENKEENEQASKQESVNKKESIEQKEIEEKKEEEAEAKVEQAEIIIEEVNAEKQEEKEEENQEEVESENKEENENQEEQENIKTKEKIKSENN